ncbi:MAG: hypothetical protein ACOYLO_16275 [Ferruginibacter sp.]
MKNNDKFAVFILTHGRANNQTTYKTLLRSGYTGKIYFLVDNEDKQQDDYKKLYGSSVIIFDKKAIAETTDAGDNFKKLNSVVYARNANVEIAQKLGLDYFWQLDDDYNIFLWKIDNEKNFISGIKIKKLDSILKAMVKFLEESDIDCVAMAQGGDFIGGEGSSIFKNFQKGTFTRKVMNSFLFSTKKPTKFIGRMNDDVNTYIVYGKQGKVFCTLPRVSLNQAQTQANSGGLTEMYLELGTYVKSFYTVMMAPSCTKIKEMGTNRRLHHQIKWNNAVPKIISEDYKK